MSAEAFVKHGFAGMDYQGRLFRREPRDWDPVRLQRYLNAYAVDYAVFARPDWMNYAQAHAGLFTLEQRVGDYGIFRVLGADPGLVLDGKADVRADYDRIEVRHAATTNLVLKLHYADWLTADAGVRLRPAHVLDDPVPFLQAVVPAGVTDFVIRKR
jgi:hypothetical protein